MRYETVQTLSDEDCKRSTGVQRSTFAAMLTVVSALRVFGRPAELPRADQLLLTLMYWREYRTEFHSGLTYAVSEATVCRTTQKIENALTQSEQFHLPGKKVLPKERDVDCGRVGGRDRATHGAPNKKQRRPDSGKKKRHTQKRS